MSIEEIKRGPGRAPVKPIELPDLKPCPFCGKQPKLTKDRSTGMYRLACPDPFMTAKTDWSITIEHAAATWNKRSDR